ncbi:MAG: hypothetical protein IKW10_00475 [Oscillospiraceae bacterium]|nr:hypothetical protein [Oscillospiraceae bacterium]
MIRTLLALRFRAFLAGLANSMNKSKAKPKKSVGTWILLGLLVVYALGASCVMMYLLFDFLVAPYHLMRLDWLYFGLAGTMALGIALLGSVFASQSQLYDAKDNALLLSMPIPPKYILLTRIMPLLSMNLLLCAIIMVPAMVVYAINVGFSLGGLALQILAMVMIALLAQAFSCLLGWLLHLLLKRMNKAFGALLFMVLFLSIYFGIYSQASSILNSMAMNGQKIADTYESWVWPLYAMGMGCTGSWLMLAFVGIAVGVFGLVYWILSVTFLKTATSVPHTKRRKLEKSAQVKNPIHAVTGKEWKKFLNTPVYLTNMGMGILMIAALPIAAIIFRGKLMDLLPQLEMAFPNIRELIPVLICAVLVFLSSTAMVSTPSVSLEGKNLWILKSLPIAPRQILLGKLRLHLLLTVPLSAISGLVLGILFQCHPAELILVTVIPALSTSLSGVAGMVCGLKWAKLDYISETYPCKQSVAILVCTFGLMGIPVVFGLAYYFLLSSLSPTAFLALCAGVLAVLNSIFYRCLLTWGIQKWEQL